MPLRCSYSVAKRGLTLLGYPKSRIVHTQRLKKHLGHVLVQRDPGNNLNHGAKDIRGGAVLPAVAGLKSQRLAAEAVGKRNGIRLRPCLLLFGNGVKELGHGAFGGRGITGIAKPGGHGKQIAHLHGGVVTGKAFPELSNTC